MATRKATMEICDNPACDVERETSKDEPAFGYHIDRGFVVMSGGGRAIPRVYACSFECLAAAVQARINEVDR